MGIGQVRTDMVGTGQFRNGLFSVSRLKVPRLSVSSRSHTKFWNLSHLGLVSDENFWDSLVSVASRLLQFYLYSSRSRPDLDEYFLNKI